MALKSEFSRVLTKGGVITSSYLKDILTVAKIAGNDFISLGSRQDILFKQDESTELKILQLKPHKFQLFDRDFAFQNVVSSLVSVDILPATYWLNSEIYQNILDQIVFKHTLRINIVDPKQNLIPLFSGNLNFIASETPDFWFLYIRKGLEDNTEKWPGLIASNDIAPLAMHLENIWTSNKELTINELEKELTAEFELHSLESDEELCLPKGYFPSYNGLNKSKRYDSNWIDLYIQDNHYSIEFINEVLDLCEKTGQEKICITPWKTFLIKGISSENKPLWEGLIIKAGLNLKNSNIELNWRLPLLDKKAYKIKESIVKKYNELDVRNFGLSVTILTKPMEVFTTAVIKVDRGLSLPGILINFCTYSIYYASDFNPNNSNYILFEKNLSKSELPEKLMELTKHYQSGNIYTGQETWKQFTKKNVRQSLALQ